MSGLCCLITTIVIAVVVVVGLFVGLVIIPALPPGGCLDPLPSDYFPQTFYVNSPWAALRTTANVRFLADQPVLGMWKPTIDWFWNRAYLVDYTQNGQKLGEAIFEFWSFTPLLYVLGKQFEGSSCDMITVGSIEQPNWDVFSPTHEIRIYGPASSGKGELIATGTFATLSSPVRVTVFDPQGEIILACTEPLFTFTEEWTCTYADPNHILDPRVIPFIPAFYYFYNTGSDDWLAQSQAAKAAGIDYGASLPKGFKLPEVNIIKADKI